MTDHYLKNAILKCVYDQTGITPTVMKGDSRKSPVSRARYLAMLACEYGEISNAETARLLDMDHTSVLHGLTRAKGTGMADAAQTVLSRAQEMAAKERQSASNRRARMRAAVLTIRTDGEAA